jgi:putative addiction module CopG family antidote
MINGLPEDLEQFVEQELASGKYASRDELVTEAVRLLRERERRLKGLREKILPALERLDRGEYTEYNEGSLRDLIDNVKVRGRARLAERHNPTS